MILCAKSIICRCSLFCFVQHYLKVCHGRLNLVFRFSLVQSLVANFIHFAQNLVKTVCLTTPTKHFSAPKIFLEQLRLYLNIFSVSHSTSGERNDCMSWLLTNHYNRCNLTVPFFALSHNAHNPASIYVAVLSPEAVF